MFLGIRQSTEQAEITATLDVSAGIGGIAMRFDELANLDVEETSEVVTATMHAYGLRQSWSYARSTADGEVSLRVLATPPTTPGKIDMAASCDRLTAEVLDGDSWVEIANRTLEDQFPVTCARQLWTGNRKSADEGDKEVIEPGW